MTANWENGFWAAGEFFAVNLRLATGQDRKQGLAAPPYPGLNDTAMVQHVNIQHKAEAEVDVSVSNPIAVDTYSSKLQHLLLMQQTLNFHVAEMCYIDKLALVCLKLTQMKKTDFT